MKKLHIQKQYIKSKNLFYQFFLLCLFFFSACKSPQVISKKVMDYEKEGKPCEGVDYLAETFKKKDKFDTKKHPPLVDLLGKTGNQCLEKILLTAKKVGDKADTKEEFEQAYATCLTMKSRYDQIKSIPLLGTRAKVSWKPEYDAYNQSMYDGITEVFYQQAIKAMQSDLFEEAYQIFGTIEARNYGATGYKETKVRKQEAYEKRTKQLFQLASETYQKAQSFKQRNLYESAYNQFATVTQRNQYPNLNSQEISKASELLKDCAVQITELMYQEALLAMNAKKFETAYNLLSNVYSRAGNYKGNTFELRKQAYDEVTKEMHEQGLRFYESKKYKTAYLKLLEVKERTDYLNLVGNLDEKINESFNRAKINFYFQYENTASNSELAEMEIRIKEAIQDEFIIFTEQTFYSGNAIQINITNDFGQFYNQTSPNEQEPYEKIYVIKSENSGDTLTYYWTEPVNYTVFSGKKELNCTASYKINRGYYGEEEFTVSDTYSDEVEYYVKKDDADLDQLTLDDIPKTNNYSIPIEPNTSLAYKFNVEKRLFQSEEDMSKEAHKKVLPKIEEALIKDLKAIAAAIE